MNNYRKPPIVLALVAALTGCNGQDDLTPTSEQTNRSLSSHVLQTGHPSQDPPQRPSVYAGPVLYSGPELPPGERHSSGERSHGELPQPISAANVDLRVVMPRNSWGVWESVRFDYYLENVGDEPVAIENADVGRGFAGRITYLRDAAGKVRSVGHLWADAKEYPPRFHGRTETIQPGEQFAGIQRLAIAAYFGRLEPGTYTLQVAAPAGRLAVDGQSLPQLVSQPVTFQVVALSPEMRTAMSKPVPEQSGDVRLEHAADKILVDPQSRSIKLTLVNDSDATIFYSGYFDSLTVLHGCDYFAGDAKWHESPMGWCGVGVTTKQIKPGQQAELSFHLPDATGPFVRFALQVSNEDRNTGRKIVSPLLAVRNNLR